MGRIFADFYTSGFGFRSIVQSPKSKNLVDMRNLIPFWAACALLFFASCTAGKKSASASDPLEQMIAGLKRDSVCSKVLKNKGLYEVQIIYTQIDRDPQQQPIFRSYTWNLDSTRYFYPASMVKMPLALLALEKINHLRRSGYPRLTRNTPYRLDSLRAFQQKYETDPTAPDDKPSIAHDIRQIFTVSDNLAYNHLFEFLGRESINNSLIAKGYTRTGIVHRFNYPGRDNRYSSPIRCYDERGTVLSEPEKNDPQTWINPQSHTRKGKGYYNAADSLVKQPFEMNKKNWFALTDMERMLRAIIFPEAIPPVHRFDLTDDDYRFVRHCMGIFPRECDFPKYDSTYTDGYSKFLLFGQSKHLQSGAIRSFNKIGEAYGTLTDVAYIVDFDNNTEFILAATILCNADGIFNDDHYDYEPVGLPFMEKLGRAVYDFELKRKRPVQPDLGTFRAVVR